MLSFIDVVQAIGRAGRKQGEPAEVVLLHSREELERQCWHYQQKTDLSCKVNWSFYTTLIDCQSSSDVRRSMELLLAPYSSRAHFVKALIPAPAPTLPALPREQRSSIPALPPLIPVSRSSNIITPKPALPSLLPVKRPSSHTPTTPVSKKPALEPSSGSGRELSHSTTLAISNVNKIFQTVLNQCRVLLCDRYLRFCLFTENLGSAKSSNQDAFTRCFHCFGPDNDRFHEPNKCLHFDDYKKAAELSLAADKGNLDAITETVLKYGMRGLLRVFKVEENVKKVLDRCVLYANSLDRMTHTPFRQTNLEPRYFFGIYGHDFYQLNEKGVKSFLGKPLSGCVVSKKSALGWVEMVSVVFQKEHNTYLKLVLCHACGFRNHKKMNCENPNRIGIMLYYLWLFVKEKGSLSNLFDLRKKKLFRIVAEDELRKIFLQDDWFSFVYFMTRPILFKNEQESCPFYVAVISAIDYNHFGF